MAHRVSPEDLPPLLTTRQAPLILLALAVLIGALLTTLAVVTVPEPPPPDPEPVTVTTGGPR